MKALTALLERVKETLKTEPAAVSVFTGLVLRQLVVLDVLHLNDVKQAAIVRLVDLAVAAAIVLFIRARTVTKHTLAKQPKTVVRLRATDKSGTVLEGTIEHDVLKVIIKKGPVSTAEIAESTSLQISSVLTAVKSLRTKNAIENIIGKPGPGNKAQWAATVEGERNGR